MIIESWTRLGQPKKDLFVCKTIKKIPQCISIKKKYFNVQTLKKKYLNAQVLRENTQIHKY